jgi:hypothetical protein
MASNSRNLGKLLGTDTKIKTDDIAGGVQLGLSFYTDEASLPTEGNILGAKAYAELEGTLHLWNGYGWGPIAVTAWDYTPPPDYLYQGSNYGYAISGVGPAAPSGHPTWQAAYSAIQKFSYVSDENATNIGDVISSAYEFGATANKSSTDAYVAGGADGVKSLKSIQQISFSSDGNAVSRTGELYRSSYVHAANSSSVNGYISSGTQSEPAVPIYNTTLSIDKFTFASSDGSTLLGDLFSPHDGYALGWSTPDEGYVAAGYRFPIDKFPFASDAFVSVNAGTVGGGLYGPGGASAGTLGAGLNSTEYGYWAGIRNPNSPAPQINDYLNISKFPFASGGAPIGMVGSLTYAAIGGKRSGSSKVTDGYVSGGLSPVNGVFIDDIQKFPFASDVSASHVGNLAIPLMAMAGTQN